MNLVVDIGNTLAKAAVVERSKIIDTFCAEQLEQLALDSVVERYGIKRSIVCSTRGEGERWAEYLRGVVGHCLLFDATVPTPLRVDYDCTTLGADRLAAAVGAAVIYPGVNLMVVDFGTAITIDFISADGLFEGGFISPGVSLRLLSLHEHTASLPLCTPQMSAEGVAKKTSQAIASGVINGITYEIEGYIRAKNRENCELFVIFSGGDSFFFDKRIKNTIFADRDILFRGLDTILDYNA